MIHRTPRQRWHTRMTERQPGEWRQLVDAIADETTRLVVANIVWWDWFGLRTMEQRRPELDTYLNGWNARKPPEADAQDVRMALQQVGYTARYARQRI